jgi:hypothetical protein
MKGFVTDSCCGMWYHRARARRRAHCLDVATIPVVTAVYGPNSVEPCASGSLVAATQRMGADRSLLTGV